MAASISFLSDNETKVDFLNAEAIASTISKLIVDRPDRPITVGVHGDWGAGKSSVLEMIEAALTKETDVLCLKFNGWRFQGFEDAKVALLEGIVTDLLQKRPALKRADDAVKDVFRRVDWLKLAKRLGGLALAGYTGIPTPEQLQLGLAALERFASDPAAVFSKENVQAAVSAMKSAVTLKPGEDGKHIPAEVEEFRKAFDKLLAEAKVSRLVVLIDDLDRCLPATAIETLEAIRLFVFTSKTAFVIAADEAMIEYAVRHHFPDLPDASGPQTYARNYLEKLIQVPFRIPSLGETETRIYVSLLLLGAVLGDEDEGFARVLTVARERLRRPWTNSLLDAATVKGTLGAESPQIQEALRLSDQVGPLLASGTKGNPRQIKRFINTILLRQRTAEARGFGAEVQLPVLAKLLLAERYLPPLYEQIATVAANSRDGKCGTLATLERSAKGLPAETSNGEAKPPKAGAPVKATSMKEAGADPVEAFGEWLTYPGVTEWVKLEPPLGSVDLRPYLFVAKERRDYFSGATLLGALAVLANKLFGTKLAVQACDGELRRLSTGEATQVFEAVRARITAGGRFDTQPPGMDGLAVLVKSQPGLQSSLLDFLEHLPSQELGPWAVQGWAGVLSEGGAVERFRRLLETWSTITTNVALRTAAGAALKLQRKDTR